MLLRCCYLDAVVKNGKASSLQMYPDNVNVRGRDVVIFDCFLLHIFNSANF